MARHIDSNATKVIAIDLLVTRLPPKVRVRDAATKRGTNRAIEKFGGDSPSSGAYGRQKIPDCNIEIVALAGKDLG